MDQFHGAALKDSEALQGACDKLAKLEALARNMARPLCFGSSCTVIEAIMGQVRALVEKGHAELVGKSKNSFDESVATCRALMKAIQSAIALGLGRGVVYTATTARGYG